MANNSNTTISLLSTNKPEYGNLKREGGEEYEDKGGMGTFVVINIVISCFVILVNAFVAFLFYYKRALLGKPSNKILLSLSICDLLAGICIVFHVFMAVSPIFDYEECHACFVSAINIDIFTTFIVEAGVFHLCLITADRFLSLFFALRYRDLVTRSTISRLIFVGWIVPFLTSAIQVTYLYPLYSKAGPTEEQDEHIMYIEMWYSIISFVFYMAIPFFLNGIAFIMMFVEIRKLLLKTPSRRLRHTSGISSQQRRVIYIFGMMYICFTTLTLPYFTLRLLVDTNHKINYPYMLDIFYTMKNLTSLCNPMLYSAMNREFRSIAGLWMKKRRQEITSTVQKLATAPVYIQQHSTTKRPSIRSSISGQGGRACDSGIYEGRTADTLTNLMTAGTSVDSECVKQDDSRSTVSENTV